MGNSPACQMKYSRIHFSYYNLSESNGFTCVEMYRGVHSGNSKTVIDIPFTELETVSNIQASYTLPGSKTKKIKDFAKRSLIGSSFYAGISAHSFIYESFPLDYPIEYSYQTENQKLLFLSFLRLNTTECVDTISYSIKVPDKLMLVFELVGDTSNLKSLIIDSVISPNEITYTFLSLPKNRLAERFHDSSGLIDKTVIPAIRLSVMPRSENDGYAYMNSWYNKLIQPQSDLNKESILVINKWGEGKTGLELIKSVFDSIKAKISYIDFENGLGAVQPRNVNDVLMNRQGDCKDMANLLRQCLRHFDIPAWVAISSTVSHPYDLDFPCISSANHLICVSEWDNQTYFLDATERYGVFGMPSRHIQGKHIYVINNENGKLILVPVIESELNKRQVFFNLIQSGDKLTGEFNIVFHGLSMIDFVSLLSTRNTNDHKEILQKYLEQHFGNLIIKKFTTENNDTSFVINGQVESKNVFTTIDKSTYLSQKMLMYPHFFPEKVGLLENLVLYTTINNSFEYIIKLDHEIKLRPVDDELIENEGLRFLYNVSSPENDQIAVYYDFKCESIVIGDQNRLTYNIINSKINSLLNKKIIYE